MVKKKSKKENMKKTKKNIKQKSMSEDNQFKIIVGIMLGLIFLVVAIFVISNLSNEFTYLGLEYERINEGDLILYTSNIVIRLPDGSIRNSGFYFRNDPRKLKDLDIDGIIDIPIGLIEEDYTYVAVNPNIEGCEDNMLALINLGLYLNSIESNPKSASTDEEFAEENNFPHITCESETTNPKIIIQKGDENSIELLENECYVLTFNECEITKVTERFTVAAIAHSSGNYDI